MINFDVDLQKLNTKLLPCQLYGNIHEKGMRPAILIFPGGAYHMVCDREKYPVMQRFYKLGYNSFYLNYATADRYPEIKFPAHVLQALFAIKYMRKNATALQCTGEVVTCGFSAGGHLSGSCAVLYHNRKLLKLLEAKEEDVKPTAAVMSYAVITAKERYLQYESFRYLTGSENRKDYGVGSLEKFVSKKTAPVFLWHTTQDILVPPQNSILFAKKLADCGVPFELHVFEQGIHGLALADETSCEGYPELVLPDVAKWVELCDAFLRRRLAKGF